MPGAKQPEPETTVGEMWEDYLEWKETQVEPTTFRSSYLRSYTNIIKGQKWDNKASRYKDTGTGIFDLVVGNECAEKIIASTSCKALVIQSIQALSEAFNRAQSLGKLKLPNTNPLFDLHKKVGESAKEKYKSTISDDGEIVEWWQVQDAEENELERDRLPRED